MAISSPKEMVQSQIATHNVTSPVGVEKMAEGRNRMLNESASVSKSPADITDALEEMGMAKSHLSKPDISKMKVRQGARTNFDALGRIADYYDKLPDMPQDAKLRDLVKHFKQFDDLLSGGDGGGQVSSDDILAALRDFDADPSHQFAALENIRADAAAGGASEAYLNLLDSARDTFNSAEMSRDVKAGFAVAQTAHDFAAQFGTEPEQIREGYRELLRDNQHMGQIFDIFQGFNLAMNFNEVVDTFMKVAGADMASFGPSTDPVQLNEVVQELAKLKKMTTLFSAAETALNKLSAMFPDIKDAPQTPTRNDITSRMLHYSSSNIVSIADAERIVVGLDDQDLAVPVAAINFFRDMHGEIPDGVMPSMTARNQQSKTLLELSTRLVELEEASYID